MAASQQSEALHHPPHIHARPYVHSASLGADSHRLAAIKARLFALRCLSLQRGRIAGRPIERQSTEVRVQAAALLPPPPLASGAAVQVLLSTHWQCCLLLLPTSNSTMHYSFFCRRSRQTAAASARRPAVAAMTTLSGGIKLDSSPSEEQASCVAAGKQNCAAAPKHMHCRSGVHRRRPSPLRSLSSPLLLTLPLLRLQSLGVHSWPTWGCEASKFSWRWVAAGSVYDGGDGVTCKRAGMSCRQAAAAGCLLHTLWPRHLPAAAMTALRRHTCSRGG